jgi:hypothetical protein
LEIAGGQKNALMVLNITELFQVNLNIHTNALGVVATVDQC